MWNWPPLAPAAPHETRGPCATLHQPARRPRHHSQRPGAETTLLNHILTNQQGVKTAVLVNEFGEIGIDNDLVVTTDEDMVELSNSCICCSINGELMEAVERVIERPEPLDYIVVETTGLADPASGHDLPRQ